MSKYLILLILLSGTFLSSAQQLPDWVLEMQKPNPDYILLKKQYNAFWSDKRTGKPVGNTQLDVGKFSIDESYGYLRHYMRQYREMIKVQPRRNPAYRIEDHSRLTSSAAAAGSWEVCGPKDAIGYQGAVGIPFGVGRINHIAFSGTNPNVMYAVGPSALFISTDTGTTWNSTGTDFMDFHLFRTVTVDPYNDSIIYLGTGDFFGIGPNDAGVLKSTDFGQTFTAMSNGIDTTLINVIALNKTNTNHLVAGGFKGIWTSFDAGNSWQKTLTVPTTNQVYDIKFKPGSSDTLYATTAIEFFLSSDGGLTWNPGFNNFQFTSTNSEQLLLGVSEAAPEVVYIFSQQDFGNVYKSNDGGNTFTAKKLFTAPGLIGYDTNLYSYGQGAYDFTFNADPVNPDRLYSGSISFYESTDGGTTWPAQNFNWAQSSMSLNLHCDQHYVGVNPLLPDRVWAANDGGVYMKMHGDTAFVPKMKNLCVTQAYHLDADNFYDSTFAVGTQDNGAYFTNNGSNFYMYIGGDVFAKIYCAYNSNAAIYTWGSNFSSGTHNINIHTGSGSLPLNVPGSAITEALSITPTSPLTAFAASTNIWETNDMNGNPVSWRMIYDNHTPYDFIGASHCLADSNIFYALRTDGYLFRTFNALVNQPQFDSVAVPGTPGTITSIATVPNDPDVIYLTSDKIYKSVDQGQTWADVTSPSMNALYGFQEIVADPFTNDGSVYVAGTNRIWYANDTTGWIDFSAQLPNVSYINDITVKKFNSQVRKVMCTILNRSIWQSPVFQNLPTEIDEVVSEPLVQLYPNPVKEILTIELDKNENINHVIIYDVRGRQVAATRDGLQKNKVSIDTSQLRKGVYIIEILAGERSILRKITVAG